MRLTLTITIAAVALFLAIQASSEQQATSSQQPELTMSVRAGFGDTGAYLIGEWLPVRVTLSNPAGGADRRVRVEVNSVGSTSAETLGTYAREVDLPAQSLKVVTLYAYTSSYARELQVRLVEGNRVVKSATARIEPYEGLANVLVGVASTDPSLLNALNGEGIGHPEEPPDPASASPNPPMPTPGRALVVHIKPDDVPEMSQALDSLDVLVLDDMPTGGLTGEQRQALEGWVARGGMLIGMGRPAGGDALAGVADLLPVNLGPSRSVSSLDSLGDLVASPIASAGSILVPGATLRGGTDAGARSLASEDDATLAALRELGAGHVAYLALSPAVSPLNTWAGTIPLMKRIIAEHPVRQSLNAARRTSNLSYIYFSNFGGGLFDIPGLDLPSPLGIALFLIVYVLLVGPVNFIILRRMRRQEWAWATVPALVLVFSVGAYLIGVGVRGSDSVVLRADLIATTPGARMASTIQFLGLFSPTRNTYNLELGAPSLVSELNTYGFSDRPSDPARVVSGAATRLEGVNINTWSLRGFMAEGMKDASSPLELELRLGTGVIEGTARNRGNAQLEDVAVLQGKVIAYLGGLAPGEEKAVRMGVSRGAFEPTGYGGFGGAYEELLPSPSGVSVGSISGPYSTGPSVSSDEFRRYSRKLKVLEAAISNLVTYAPPTKLEVLAFAWARQATSDLRVPGSSREEGVTLWTSRASVRGAASEARLSQGLVPISIYAPGNKPYWIASRAPESDLQLEPYADITLRLPQGMAPASVRCIYRLGSALQGKVSVLAYDPRAGSWTPIGELSAASGNSQDSSFDIPNPATYTGPAGDITVRFVAEPAGQTVSLINLEFEMNAAGGQP